MVFTVLYYKNLEPLIEIDDYISAVWNNKYFTAGEFEIICRTTNERILKLVRNNFITLNGTDEIAVIETVEFSKDEEQGAIMKITGHFAQSLLNKRIIWDKTLLNGTVEGELHRLITKNALNPSNIERKLDSESEKETLTGRILNIPETAKNISDVEIISDTEYSNEGTLEGYIDYSGGLGILNETGLKTGAVIETTEAAITETKNDGTSKTIEYRKDGAVKKLYSLTTDIISNSSVKNGVLKTFVRNYSVYDFYGRLYGVPAILESDVKLEDNMEYYYYYAGNDKTWIKIEIKAKIDAPEQVPMSSKIKCLNKAEYLAGNCGIACFDGYLWVRVVKKGASVDTKLAIILNNVQDETLRKYNIYNTFFLRKKTTDYSIFAANGAKDELIVKINTLLTETLTPTNSTTGASDNLSTTGVIKLELRQVNSLLTHYLYAVVTLKNLEIFDYLKLGKIEGVTDQIVLQLIGDNLQEKVEEILQLYNLGMRARYVKTEKKIYFDFYKGYNRTKGTLQPIIYSESLDNLESYNVCSSNAAANVALIYSENDGEPVSGTAGSTAGAARRETYINKTNDVGYIGADYIKQLQEEGNLSLQSFTLAIGADIDNRAYVYRKQFYIGDVATIIIKDLNVEYNVRILEAREYNDINGYSIELVLGE